MVARRRVAAVEADRGQECDPREVAIVPRHLDDAKASPTEGAGWRLELFVVCDAGEAACSARIVAGIQGDLRVEKRNVRGVGRKRGGLCNSVTCVRYLAKVALDARKHDERIDILRSVDEALREELFRLLETARLVCGHAVGELPDAVLRVAAGEDGEGRGKR